MDFKTDEVADDKKRGVVERFVILVELFVCFLEVSTFGLVFPREEATLPYVGVTFISATGFGDALLVGIVSADFISLSWMRDIESFAEIAEVIGGCGTLGESAGVPLPDKVQEIDRHGAEAIVTD
jgi:hypothetical protein